jgi:Pyruvate/2-oxoacid:ferredoxin oxidoreductase delta subunit
VLEADKLISLPKLKTHGLTKITGAIKNQFGCIPGVLKGEFHAKLPSVDLFSRMLVDLTRFLKPCLYIMDGIIAMEGNGPNGGTPKPMNVLLFSSDPAALDATFCRLIGVEPQHVVTLKWAEKLDLGTYREERIELLGDPLESFQDFHFDVRHGITPLEQSMEFMPGFSHIFKRLLSPRPVIEASTCTRCGTCVQMCPVTPKAVDFFTGDRTRPPTYKYNFCIRCYCCQEICPESAIFLKVPLFGRIIHR